jgi:MFS family permease
MKEAPTLERLPGKREVPTNPNSVSATGPLFSLHLAAVRRQILNWWREKNLTREFWSFLAVSFLFDSGMFIFFLLYNLYLLDLGFREDFLGWTTGAMSLGLIAGSLPAGLFARRFGLRRSLLVCLTLVPAFSALRAASSSAPWLLVLALFGGAASSLWAVSLPPIVAKLTDDRNRPFGFSVVFASGIGFGILAGLVGGYLPKILLFLSPGLFACALAALALWPASRLRFGSAPAREKRRFPRNPFVFRFFPALAIWSFATGAFNPFFNAYFSHSLAVPVERIGAIFSGAQFVQVLAILAAPLVFRRFGLITGIFYTQLACALCLEWLAAGPRGWGAAIAYAGYAGFQWMSEPGMYSLLMNKVNPSERSGASAVNLLVISGTQAVAAATAGVAFTRFGYPTVMTVIGGAILAAAFLFRFLLGSESFETSGRAAAETSRCGVA